MIKKYGCNEEKHTNNYPDKKSIVQKPEVFFITCKQDFKDEITKIQPYRQYDQSKDEVCNQATKADLSFRIIIPDRVPQNDSNQSKKAVINQTICNGHEYTQVIINNTQDRMDPDNQDPQCCVKINVPFPFKQRISHYGLFKSLPHLLLQRWLFPL
jgi:hypothetical protein